MSRHKSLILRMEITVAKKAWDCQANDMHYIAKGERHLTIKTDKLPLHYCLACARTFLADDIERLKALLEEAG